jgi:protein-S-isoprenylcysteine O-methyltransferase Ste14
MIIEIVILSVAGAVFFSAEIFLVIKEHARGKGGTAIDRCTRSFNFIALGGAILLAAGLAWIPFFRFAPEGVPAIFWTGVAVLALGLALRYWSVAVLGRYFRTTIEVEKGQKVVRRGPYRLVRHPSYSGLILFCLGYGLAVQSWLSLAVTAVLPAVSLVHRIKIEEEALSRELGEDYAEYRKSTKRLIPWIW